MSIALWNKLNERAELQDERIKQLDTRLAALEKHVVAVSAALESADSTIANLTKRVTAKVS